MRQWKNLAFVATQVTLLERLTHDAAGGTEADWARFFDLYYPVMVTYAELMGAGETAEDIASAAIIKLVSALQRGLYEHREGVPFRAYVKTVLRNALISQLRHDASVSHAPAEFPSDAQACALDEPGALIDAVWRASLHRAAIEHVLDEMPLAERTRAIARAVMLDGRDVADVARIHSLSRKATQQILRRVSERIRFVEDYYGE